MQKTVVGQPERTFTVRDEFLPFSPPLIGDDEIAEVVQTLKSDWITTGPKTKQFEREFCEKFGAPKALAVNSCTAGLHLALATLGVGEGDEVIVPTHTFCSTANVVEHLKAKPVLVDVEPDTLNISPEAIERAITSKTKAIMPVHYAGHPAEMDTIQSIADAKGIHVVEDAAHPVSAKYKGKFIGSGTNPTSFSFYATKNMTSAEGGMLTGTPEFIERATILGLHGMNRDAYKRYDKGGSWYYEVVYPGFKYNMTDIQSALGLVQLRKLDEFQARRRKIVQAYQDAFGTSEALQIPTERKDVVSSWHLYVLRIRPEFLTIGRDQFIEELKARNVGTSVHYIPVHMHPFYRDKYGYKPESFPNSYDGFQRMMSLPLNNRMTMKDAEYVIDAVFDIVRKNRA